MFGIKESRCIRMIVVCLCAVAIGAFPAHATKQDVTDAKSKASALEQEKARVEASLKNLEGLKSDTAAYVRELDREMETLDNELSLLADRITAKEEEITVTIQELEEAKETETKQYADMKLRIKYMYERGDSNILDMLLQSTDMMQFLNRVEYIQKISEYDREKMDEYEATRQTIEEKEAVLEQEHADLLTMQEETEAKQESVQTLLTQKNQELANYESQISTAEGQISQYEADIKAQEAKIAQLEAEIKRKEEEARKAAEAAKQSYKTVSLGDISFQWPCPASGRITSGFGKRSSPTKGASTYHQGIDIGASTGASIVASAAGTVVAATYSYSSGNYIMINHGGGVYTVYMHCSSLLVSEGATVKQGQTIAKVGSTGYSTGPHLHFGIRSGGTYVNPSKYVSP